MQQGPAAASVPLVCRIEIPELALRVPNCYFEHQQTTSDTLAVAKTFFYLNFCFKNS
jgi:hypothetical protein